MPTTVDDAALHEVPVAPLLLERFRAVLDEEQYSDLVALSQRARQLLEGRVVWCVNSTASGGGVAEMLRSLLAYTRGAGVDIRWLVLAGNPEFFAVTKRLHNRLHGALGDGGPLGAAQRAIYEANIDRAASDLLRRARPGDVVVLHDPQTAGLAPALRAAGVRTVWRIHIGVDTPNDQVREAWGFLREYVCVADALVFSRELFVWEGLDRGRVVIVPPSIDPLSPKNQELASGATAAILRVVGLLEPGDTRGACFVREDGTTGRVGRRAGLVQEAPLRDADRVVAQVSRWDRLKDPVGVMGAFVEHLDGREGVHLVLAGPDVSAVFDDPEGQTCLAEITAAWHALPLGQRRRIHLASLPMDDADENAAMVNALQRHATVVVQKSLAEGFGLTVAEAMWKRRPVVASRVGGIQDQIVDSVSGVLVDPSDGAQFGAAVRALLDDPDAAARMGAAAHDRVREAFLEPRHLRQWVDVIDGLGPGRPH